MKISKVTTNLFLVTFFLSILITSSCSNQKTPVLAQTKETENFKEANKSNQPPTPTATPKIENQPPKIISRKSWKAKKTIGKGKTHKIKYITIHHTASKQKPKLLIEKKLRNLQNFSQSNAKLANGKRKKAWIDIPYHYYIAPNGDIAEARQIEYAGDTNTNYDPTGHALIVLEGNFEKEKPTQEQIESMKKLTDWLAKKYSVSRTDIKAHNDYTKTACPGKNLKELLSSTFSH